MPTEEWKCCRCHTLNPYDVPSGRCTGQSHGRVCAHRKCQHGCRAMYIRRRGETGSTGFWGMLFGRRGHKVRGARNDWEQRWQREQDLPGNGQGGEAERLLSFFPQRRLETWPLDPSPELLCQDGRHGGEEGAQVGSRKQGQQQQQQGLGQRGGQTPRVHSDTASPGLSQPQNLSSWAAGGVESSAEGRNGEKEGSKK